MKAYLLVTGAIFGFLDVLHLVHLFSDGHSLAVNSAFVWGNIAAIALCTALVVWAWRLWPGRASSGSGTG